MSGSSAIEWTEATWNPTTGCNRISSGCDNCYALTLAKRLKAMGQDKYQSDGDPETSGPGFGVAIHPYALDEPKRWKKPRVVFVNSMSDLFHAKVPLTFVSDVFSVIQDTPQHTYQILTKRPRRVRKVASSLPWPENLWLGTSVEHADTLHRLQDLRAVPAAVRFVSAEPLLGSLAGIDLTGIDWLIAGGESGPHFRPAEIEWFRELRNECHHQQTAFFFKQWGGRSPKANGRTLDGRTWDEMPNSSRVVD